MSAPRVLREQTRKQSHPQTQRRSSLRRNRLFQTNVHGGTADPETLRVRARTEAEPDRQTRPANRDAMEAIAVPLRGALPRLKARTGDRWGLAFQPRRHQAQGPPAQDLGAAPLRSSRPLADGRSHSLGGSTLPRLLTGTMSAAGAFRTLIPTSAHLSSLSVVFHMGHTLGDTSRQGWLSYIVP